MDSSSRRKLSWYAGISKWSNLVSAEQVLATIDSACRKAQNYEISEFEVVIALEVILES